VIRKFSLLEELELSECSGIEGSESIEAIAKSCPQLNHFRLIKKSFLLSDPVDNNDGEALAISGPLWEGSGRTAPAPCYSAAALCCTVRYCSTEPKHTGFV